MGALWACITLATVSVRVEKSMISPDCCTAGGWEDADGCWERGDVGDGTGEGYAKQEESAEGDSAQTAV